MATINWSTCNTNTDWSTQNLKLVRVPRIYYIRFGQREPKNIHELIKGVLLEKTIQLGHQLIYE